MDKKTRTPWNAGKNSSRYKHGLYSKYAFPEDRLGRLSQYRKAYRHRKGISKLYMEEYVKTPEEKKENKRIHRKIRKYRQSGAGVLTKKIIQLVYEDNIKKYGTLTCYICLENIEFGEDNLEHKVPLFRGGTNEYHNLGVACQSCNFKKSTKTYEEYMAIQNKE